MSELQTPTAEELADILRRGSGVLLAVGTVQILLGTAAVLAPQVATTVGVEFMAVMLCISGIAQGFLMFRVRGWRGTSLLAVGSLASLAAGGLILRDPQGGAIAITLLLAMACGVDGLSRVALGLSPAGASSRGALVVCGLASIGMGVLLAVEWPGDAVWAVGLLLGVNLMMGGVGLSGVAIAVRNGGGPKPA